MAQMMGADVGDLERGAAGLESIGSRIGGMAGPLRSQLYSSHWHGAAAERFRAEWDSVHGPGLAWAEEFLRSAGRQLRHEAEQQRHASNTGGGSFGLAQCTVAPRDMRLLLADRYARSRSAIQERIAEINEQVAALDAQLAAMPLGILGIIVNPAALGLMRRIEALSSERRNLEQLDDLGDRQVLSISGVGEDQRITEVHGDLTAADRVIIHVPGMGTDLGDYNGELEGERGHLDALRLKEAAERQSGLNVAVISFADYDVPQHAGSAALEHGARDGAPKLRDLVSYVQSLGHGSQSIAVVGHSYGSVVVGHAMLQGLDVREVVVAGSPGMGATRAEMHEGSPGVRLTAVAPGSLDPVPHVDAVTLDVAGPSGGHIRTGPHGISPDTPGFGSEEIIDGGGNVGHSGYFQGTTGDAIARQLVN